MTREEAEIRIRAVFNNYFYFAGDREADEVIEALRQEPCEDAISRKFLLDHAVYAEFADGVKGWIVEKGYVEDALTVQPKPKTGHWIKTKEQDNAEPLILWKCSECLTVQRLKTKHCPNCGCTMKGE